MVPNVRDMPHSFFGGVFFNDFFMVFQSLSHLTVGKTYCSVSGERSKTSPLKIRARVYIYI